MYKFNYIKFLAKYILKPPRSIPDYIYLKKIK